MRFAPAFFLSPAYGLGLALIASGCGRDAPPPPPAPQVTVATVIDREINEWPLEPARP